MNKWTAKIKRLIKNKLIQKIGKILIVAFLVINLATLLFYQQRTYPNTTIGSKKMGSVKFNQLSQWLDKMALLPGQISLTYRDKTTKLTPAELGVTIDKTKMQKQAVKQESWLPVLNLIISNNLPLQLSVDESTYAKTEDHLDGTHHQPPANAEITLKDSQFMIKPETDGYKLDRNKTKNAILAGLNKNESTITLLVETVKPQVTQDQLKSDLATLKKQQDSSLTFRYQSKSKKLSSTEITTWYSPSGGTYVLSDALIKNT